jgi:hypothetical protein
LSSSVKKVNNDKNVNIANIEQGMEQSPAGLQSSAAKLFLRCLRPLPAGFFNAAGENSLRPFQGWH